MQFAVRLVEYQICPAEHANIRTSYIFVAMLVTLRYHKYARCLDECAMMIKWAVFLQVTNYTLQPAREDERRVMMII